MRIVAVMVLQRAEGLSDREAVERSCYELRLKYAAGGLDLDLDYPGFVYTVLVDMPARLRGSERPDRVFETVLVVCREAGLAGCKRMMDSTALYAVVATQDTVTLLCPPVDSVCPCAAAITVSFWISIGTAAFEEDGRITNDDPEVARRVDVAGVGVA